MVRTHAHTGPRAASQAGGVALALLLALAAAPPGIALAQPAASPAAADPADPEAIVDAMERIAGAHVGFRRSGAKGVCASGEFVASGEGARLTTASLFRAGARTPVAARFSNGGGNPRAPDNAPAVRGLSLSFGPPGAEEMEMVMINTPVFGASTVEGFADLLRSRAPDPATGQPDPGRVAAADARHPEYAAQPAYLRTTPPPASYANSPFFSVNSFVFADATGTRRHVRWTFEPVAGRVGLTPEERAARGTDYLQGELRTRVAAAPAEWRMVVVLPRDGDPLLDATVAWPEAERERVEVGTLRIASVSPAGAPGPCDAHMFNPVLLPAGVEASDDPILLIRAPAYAVSLGRRTP